VPIEIVPYEARWEEAVGRFNARLAAAGSEWGWYPSSVDDWIPARPGQGVWREHYLAVEDGREVRGAYALKPQQFQVRGRPELVTDWHGPVSEGVIDRRYNTLGLRLFRDMLKRRPLLYSWGTGGLDHAMPRMMQSLGFELHLTPFLLRVLRPARFLHRNRYLRSTRPRRLGLDLLAASGLAFAGLHGLHAVLGSRGERSQRAEAEVVQEFGVWADAIWERCRERYAVIATRDASTQNVLLPPSGWPPGIRLRIRRGGEDLGWAVVMDTQMRNDHRFGDLRVGSIVDVLALPEQAGAVVGAAFRFLRSLGVDLVMSNQSHPAWIEAFARHGFLVLPGRRAFAMSRALRDTLEPLPETVKGLHLTLMDGHGPRGV
jgi:hypothetical protein